MYVEGNSLLQGFLNEYLCLDPFMQGMFAGFANWFSQPILWKTICRPGPYDPPPLPHPPGGCTSQGPRWVFHLNSFLSFQLSQLSQLPFDLNSGLYEALQIQIREVGICLLSLKTADVEMQICPLLLRGTNWKTINYVIRTIGEPTLICHWRTRIKIIRTIGEPTPICHWRTRIKAVHSWPGNPVAEILEKICMRLQ